MVSCTITRDDRPRVNVITTVDPAGLLYAGNVTVTVNGANANPGSFSGAESGVVVVVGWGLSFDVSMTDLTNYTQSAPSGVCSSLGLALNAAQVTCTITFTYVPPPPPVVPQPVAPIAFLPILLPRRWRPIRRR